MKTVKVKQKKTEKKDIAGIIIGILFFTMLIAVVYYVADMLIISREVNMQNISGDWHITRNVTDKEVEHWVFLEDGTARTYTLNKEDGTRSNEKTYDFTLLPPEEGKTHPMIHLVPSNVRKSEKEDGTMNVRVSHVTKAEMTVEFVYDRFTTETTRMTKDLF